MIKTIELKKLLVQAGEVVYVTELERGIGKTESLLSLLKENENYVYLAPSYSHDFRKTLKDFDRKVSLEHFLSGGYRGRRNKTILLDDVSFSDYLKVLKVNDKVYKIGDYRIAGFVDVEKYDSTQYFYNENPEFVGLKNKQ